MKFELRNPNIDHIKSKFSLYKPIIQPHLEDILRIKEQWDNLIYENFVPVTMEMSTPLFFSNSMMRSFIEDCERQSLIGLISAWIVGREFSEKNQDQAKRLLLIENIYSPLLFEELKKELIDIADNTSFLFNNMLKSVYVSREFGEEDILKTFETTSKMFYEGCLLAFKDGIISYIKEKKFPYEEENINSNLLSGMYTKEGKPAINLDEMKGDEPIVNILIFSMYVYAGQLMLDDKIIFSKWANLPTDEWTEKHKKFLSITFLHFLRQNPPEKFKKEELRNIRDMIPEQSLPRLNKEISPEVNGIFLRIFG